MVFSWLCVGCKMISVFILSSTTISRKTERELSESEIEEEERGREHTPPASQAPAREIAPRKRLNPEPRALRLRLQIIPFDFAVRLRLRITPRSQPSTSNRTQIASFDFAGEPRAQITHSTSPRSHPRIALIALRSQLRNGWVLMNLIGFDQIWWIFFVGFCFCVYLLRNGIIYLFGSWENMRKCEEQEENVFSMLFSATQPNTKIFSKTFFQNATKHLKIFSFQVNSISGKYLFSGKYFT